jgi:hypothetical protein
MKKLIWVFAFTLFSYSAFAQGLTPAQKDADFRYLASLYSTYYAPLDWKNQLFGFNALNLKPWLDRAAKTTTDLDFYELCVEYVASLNDTHDAFSLPSDFVASLGFGVDIYDGVLLIDNLNRTILPASTYPFTIGIAWFPLTAWPWSSCFDFAKYAPQRESGFDSDLLSTWPPLGRNLHAPCERSRRIVVIRRQGGSRAYTIRGSNRHASSRRSRAAKVVRYAISGHHMPAELDYMAGERARFSGVLQPEDLGLAGGSQSIQTHWLPHCNSPAGLAGRQPISSTWQFRYAELTIGLIRVPNYAPPSQPRRNRLEQNRFMNANTDGLIPEMRAPAAFATAGNWCGGWFHILSRSRFCAPAVLESRARLL